MQYVKKLAQMILVVQLSGTRCINEIRQTKYTIIISLTNNAQQCTDRQTDRQTDRTDRQTDRQTDTSMRR